LVAIPLCLGIAVASGLNEFSGIIGGIVGGIVVGMISGSQLQCEWPCGRVNRHCCRSRIEIACC
jgi:MFS superfamily sulfate permease-like transporter